MKRILIYLLIIPVIIFSCEDPDAVRVPEIQDGVTMKIQVDPVYGFLDLGDIDNAELRFSLYTVNDDIDKTDIFVQYYNLGQDSTYDKVLVRSIAGSEFDGEGSLDMVFTTQNLLDLYSIASSDTITGGDVMNFFNVTTLTDGRVYPDTILAGTDYEAVNIDPGQTIGTTSSFSPGFIAYIACASDPSLWVGNYSTAVSNVNNFCGLLDCSATRDAAVSFTGTPEPFRYGMTSHDAGLWGSFDPGSLDRAGAFYDICETVVFLPSASGYGDHEGVAAGPRDPATGVFFYDWCNFFNPVCGTTTFTPL